MTDKRFFRPAGPFKIALLAEHTGAALRHPEMGEALVVDIADLARAGCHELSLFCDPVHAQAFAASEAAVIVTSEKLLNLAQKNCAILLCENPRLAFAQIAQMFYPRKKARVGIHPGAHVSPNAILGDEVEIAAGAVIESDAIIGSGSRIGANTVIAEGVLIGEACTIGPNCTVSHALIGDNVTIAGNTSIGGEGFGFVPSQRGMTKISQLGRVVIGNDVDIGNNVAIDRGSLGDTVIGDGTVLDNLIHIAHNVRIGKGCVFAAQVGIAGSTTIGNNVMMGGHAAIKDHLIIGNRVKIAAKSGVIHNIADDETIGGLPAIPTRQWHRQTATLARLAQRKVKA